MEHLGLKALEQVVGHIQEVSRAAGGVEHPQAAQTGVKVAEQADGLVSRLGRGLTVAEEHPRSGLNDAPLRPQGLDHRRHDEPLDVLAGGEVGAELGAFDRIQRAL